jgi:thiamine-phosphate pyrophosphorylase
MIGAQAGHPARLLVSVSCHSAADVARAASEGADFAFFAPVFEKQNAPLASPAGLDGLREACRQKIPVLALGGITLQNARACLDAGAAGIAAIRLFQENDIAETVRHLRG